MKVPALTRYAPRFCAAALLAGCGGSQPPIGAPGAMPQSRAATSPAPHSGSWMLPEAGSQSLLYVSDFDAVRVFSYPRGKYEGSLEGFQIAIGECADAGGNVYVADYGYGQLFEYAHGGTERIRTLNPGDASGCAVDPSSGDLAVTNLTSNSRHRTGSVAIYKNAHGKPKYYRDPDFLNYYFCGYDSQGDLFVDGIKQVSGRQVFVFAELPNGGTELVTIKISQYIDFPGGVQWDGAHVAIDDQTPPSKVYEFAISGSQGTLVGTTQLDGATSVVQPWIDGSKIIVPNAISGKPGQVLVCKYPAGGSAVKKISRHLLEPQAAVVSNAPT
jgi:hypothetical protein